MLHAQCSVRVLSQDGHIRGASHPACGMPVQAEQSMYMRTRNSMCGWMSGNTPRGTLVVHTGRDGFTFQHQKVPPPDGYRTTTTTSCIQKCLTQSQISAQLYSASGSSTLRRASLIGAVHGKPTPSAASSRTRAPTIPQTHPTWRSQSGGPRSRRLGLGGYNATPPLRPANAHQLNGRSSAAAERDVAQSEDDRCAAGQ